MPQDQKTSFMQIHSTKIDRRAFFRKSLMLSGAVVATASGILLPDSVASASPIAASRRRHHHLRRHAVPLYRLYNPDVHDHFYTTDDDEARRARRDYGYRAEGVACYVFADGSYDADDLVAFYRLYNSSAHDHFYTTSSSEAHHARDYDGYTSEGIACYVYSDSDYDDDLVPFYRLYNPSVYDHFYTTSRDERNNARDNDGYNYEGIACYVYAS